MSIDRIVDSITYTQNNTRLIALEFNTTAKWTNLMFQQLLDSQQLEFDVFYILNIRKSINSLYYSAKTSSRHREGAKSIFTITKDSLFSRWKQQQGKCYYSRAVMKPNGKRDPFQISIERLNSSIGYTLENTVFICWCFQSTNMKDQAKEYDIESDSNSNWSISKYLYTQYVQEARNSNEKILDLEDFKKENKQFLLNIEINRDSESKEWIREADWLNKYELQLEKQEHIRLQYLAYVDRFYKKWNQEDSIGEECKFYDFFDQDNSYLDYDVLDLDYSSDDDDSIDCEPIQLFSM